MASYVDGIHVLIITNIIVYSHVQCVRVQFCSLHICCHALLPLQMYIHTFLLVSVYV